jgi:1-deoxyxylulose-5-phosphate synthase
MDYISFGTSGVKISRLALGLGLRGQADEAAAQRLVEYAIDRGITLLDCANVYGPMDDRANIGRSEVVLGKAIQGKRDQVVITSKVASAIGHGPNDRGLSRYHILRAIEDSLRRLQTDHVDVYLVHVCRALWIADTVNSHAFMCVQNPYSLLNRRMESEMFGLVRDRGLGVMAYSPLGVGLLSGVYQPGQPPPSGTLWATSRRDRFEHTMQSGAAEVVSAVRRAAAALGKTPTQVALAWVLSHPEVSCAISGADTIGQLDDVLGAADWSLPADVRERLDQVSATMSTILD